jgi:hypothetical protein
VKGITTAAAMINICRVLVGNAASLWSMVAPYALAVSGLVMFFRNQVRQISLAAWQ